MDSFSQPTKATNASSNTNNTTQSNTVYTIRTTSSKKQINGDKTNGNGIQTS
jgi:hypothetical protein